MKRNLIVVLILVLSVLSNFINAQTITVSVTQIDTFAIKGLPDQPILRVNINTGNSTLFTLEKLVIKTLNDDNTDISSVNIYKTEYNRYSYADYPGESTSLIPGGITLDGDSAVFSGLTFALQPGDNYFWIVFDLSDNSKPGNKLDAFIREGGIIVSGSKYPSELQSPIGKSVILQKYLFDSFEKYEATSLKPLEWTVTYHPLQESAKWKSIKGALSENPTDAKSGLLNARSSAEDLLGKNSLLISKPLNLSLSEKPTLTFYHAQSGRVRPKGLVNDSLGLYYGFSTIGPWHFIRNYTQPTPEYSWIKREVLLPEEMKKDNVYLVFKSTAQYGNGVCVDSVTIHESVVSSRNVKFIACTHPTLNGAVQGSFNNFMMRLNIGIQGNQDDLFFSSITLNSLNTSDADIPVNGVNFYSTKDSIFSSPTLLGTGSLTGGKITFNGFNLRLESGDNYYWVNYDVLEGAIPDNILDVKIAVGDIIISDGKTYPSVELSPEGSRQIKQAIFFDDFETSDKGWILEGDFEIGKPMGKGGAAYSFLDPKTAYSRDYVLGNDLSSDGNYGKGLINIATSPLISAKYFKNLTLNFARWLNAEKPDTAVIEYQFEGETNWKNFWSPSSTINDGSWNLKLLTVNDLFDRKNFKIRFRLGKTNDLFELSGWNIDYLFISGDYIKYDAAITNYIAPLTKCGLTNGEKIKVTVKNTGPTLLQNIPLKLSIDGGKNWINETLIGTLAVDESRDFEFPAVDLSKAKIYNIIAKVVYPQDNYSLNDSVVYDLLSVPTHTLPHYDGFEADTVFWIPGGINSSWSKGTPSKFEFRPIYEGYNCWKTGSMESNISEDSYIMSPCFNLSGVEKPVIDLHYIYKDNVLNSGSRMEYSLDGGSTWSYVPADSYGFPWKWYNDSVRFFNDKTKGWTLESQDELLLLKWLNGRQVLPAAVENNSLVRLRFHYKNTSPLTTYAGFAFDAFKLMDSPDNSGVISIDDFVSPACQFANSDKLKVTVKNFGIRRIKQNDTIVIGVKINNNPIVKDTFKLAADLNVGDTRQFVLTKSVDISATGDYNIKAFAINKYPSYYGTNNDTFSLAITVYPNPLTNLPDTIYTARRDTLKVRTVKDTDYLYAWKFGATPVVGTHELDASTTGFGLHSLIVENKISHCITKDTVFIKSLIPDIGVESILSPATNCGYKTPTRPIIRIKNYGTDTMRVNQEIPVRLRLNKETFLSESIVLSKIFAPDSVYETTLTSSLNLLEARTDTLKIWTELLADDTLRNDTSTLIFQIHGYPQVFLGNDTTVKGKLTYELDAKAGYKTYLWSDGVTATQKFNISQPGKYSVTVTDAKDCANSDTINVFLKIHDLAMHALVSPTDACTQTSATSIKCQLKNTGSDTIQTDEPIILYYQVNGGDIYQDTIKAGVRSMLKPNDVYIHTFKNTYDMAAINTYSFKVKSILAGDIQPVNDSLLLDVKVFGNPHIDLGENRIERALTYTLSPGDFAGYEWQDTTYESTWEITKTHFNKSNKYYVTVTDVNGCTDRDTVTIYLMVDDLEVTNLELPRSICSLSDKENLNVKITNVGNTFINRKISVSYNLNGAGPVSDTLTFNGAAGTSKIHTFTSTANMSAKDIYSFKLEVDMTGDVQGANDTVTLSTNVLGFPNIGFNTPNDTLIVELPYTLSVDNSYSTYKWQDATMGPDYLITTDNYDPANTEYTVIVTDANGCNVAESVDVIEAVYDLAISGINIPPSNCVVPSDAKLSVSVKSNSTVNLLDKNVKLNYSLNGGTDILKETSISLSKGAVTNISFDENIDLPVGTHSIAVSLTYNEDENLADNVSTFNIVVHGNPAFGFPTDTIRTSSLPYALDAGADYESYTWNDKSTDRYLNAAAEGWYAVVVGDINSCFAKDSVYLLNATGLDNLNDDADIKLFPNPVSNYLTVMIRMEKKEDLNLDIISTDGKLVYRKILTNMDEYREDIDVSGLPKGMYYVRIYSKNSVANKKIVVK